VVGVVDAGARLMHEREVRLEVLGLEILGNLVAKDRSLAATLRSVGEYNYIISSYMSCQDKDETASPGRRQGGMGGPLATY